MPKYKVLDKVDLRELSDMEILDIVNRNRGLNWSQFLLGDLELEYKKVLANMPTSLYYVIMVDNDITRFEKAFQEAFGYTPTKEFGDYSDVQIRDAKALWDISMADRG